MAEVRRRAVSEGRREEYQRNIIYTVPLLLTSHRAHLFSMPFPSLSLPYCYFFLLSSFPSLHHLLPPLSPSFLPHHKAKKNLNIIVHVFIYPRCFLHSSFPSFNHPLSPISHLSFLSKRKISCCNYFTARHAQTSIELLKRYQKIVLTL